MAEFKSLHLLVLLGHVLEPAHHRHGVYFVASIGKVGACVLGGVVGQEAAGNHGIGHLLLAYLHGALALLVLAHRDLQLVVAVAHHEGCFTRQGIHIALFVCPELALVDGTIFQKCQFPVACLFIAPVGRQQLFPAFFHRLDAPYLESAVAITLNEVERLRVLWQWLEVKRHIALAVLVRLHKLVQFDAVGRGERVACLAHLQIGVSYKLKTEVGIVRTLHSRDIYHRLRLLQLHLRHIEGEVEESIAITGSIFCGGLLPHSCFLLCLHRHCDEGEEDGDDGFLVHIHFGFI